MKELNLSSKLGFTKSPIRKSFHGYTETDSAEENKWRSKKLISLLSSKKLKDKKGSLSAHVAAKLFKNTSCTDESSEILIVDDDGVLPDREMYKGTLKDEVTLGMNKVNTAVVHAKQLAGNGYESI